MTSCDTGQTLSIDHVGFLEDLSGVPPYLLPIDSGPLTVPSGSSCAFCGVGDSGQIASRRNTQTATSTIPAEGRGTLRIQRFGNAFEFPVELQTGRFEVETTHPIVPDGSVLSGEIVVAGKVVPVVARESGCRGLDGRIVQAFAPYSPVMDLQQSTIKVQSPTAGCMKFRISMGHQPPVFPIHVTPSTRKWDGTRQPISYETAIARLADLLLAHRPPHGRTLVYACGQIDYFTIFAFQEVFRLLGVRNLAGNAEHCLNSGAVHNEILTGQEGPFLTIDQALTGPGRFYVLNGWNGLITHPPAFYQLFKRPDFDAYMVEVAVTESAKMLASKLGPDRVLLIRSGGDAHLALAIAHEVLAQYPAAVESRFVDRYADRESFDKYTALARSESFEPTRVAERLAPDPDYAPRLLRGIRTIAARLASPDVVPINIPSVGLSQTKGVVAHCLWGSLLAMLGKYGLKRDGTPAGGTVRIPGQINAQTEVQGLSRRAFMGRIPMTDAGAIDAARRMGLPDDAYSLALHDTPRAALDYSDSVSDRPELFVCFGTQFESNMMNRRRWIAKLQAHGTTLVVVDPIPDPFSLDTADLVIPSPPHAAAAKLYQNGEWRLTLSVPRKRPAQQTRTDATIVYDTMAEIAERLVRDPALHSANADLARHAKSGYLARRFGRPEHGGGLPRCDGEVSRAVLWQRILDYMADGPDRAGPVYCRPVLADGRPINWTDLLAAGSMIYGGVGESRYRLDYDDESQVPFRNIYDNPRKFTFFIPTEADLRLPDGIILNSGRSTLSDDKSRIRFAVATFNSGKATPAVDMPAENPLFVSLPIARRMNLTLGDRVRVTNVETGESIVLPVEPTDRVKGESAYVSFHKCRAETEDGRYLNAITGHTGRCPYSSQSNFKATVVLLHREPLA